MPVVSKPQRTMPSFSGSGCRVPLDIIDLIAEQLAGDGDMVSLRACCLTCKDFIGICRKHIFSSITLSDSKSSSDQKKLTSVNHFKKLLDKRPKIANYIRSVYYHNRFDHRCGIPVLRRLHRVESLHLAFMNNDPFVWDEQEWTQIPSSLRSSLFLFIRFNNIVQLCLVNIKNLPLRIFMHLPCLADLDIFALSIDDSKAYSSKDTPKLKALRVGEKCTQAMRVLLAPRARPVIDLTYLEDFDVSLYDPEAGMSFVRQILASTERLKMLTLSGCYPDLDCDNNIAPYLSNGSLQTLKVIELSPMLDTVLNDPYLHLTRELQKIAGKNVLEELIIYVGVETDRMCTNDPSQWAALDVVLSQPNAFPYLRCVELQIKFHWYSSLEYYRELEKDLWDIGRNMFPWLTGKKMMEFNIKYSEVV